MTGSKGGGIPSLVHEALLGDAWEHAKLAATVFSDDGHYIACNLAFCELTGYERAEITRMQVGVDLAVDPKANTKLFGEIVDETRQVGTGGIRRKDGTTLRVNFWAIETRVAGLPYFVVLYWPVSERPKRHLVGVR